MISLEAEDNNIGHEAEIALRDLHERSIPETPNVRTEDERSEIDDDDDDGEMTRKKRRFSFTERIRRIVPVMSEKVYNSLNTTEQEDARCCIQ